MLKISPTDGDRADLHGLGTRYLLRGEDTGGQFALIEHTIPPHALAAPVHLHQNEDEYMFVLSGRVGVQIGDEVADVGPGELVAKPRDVPHAFWNAGDEEARLLELISPPGFAAYFEELAPVLRVEGPPDLEKLAALQERYALQMDFDTIMPLMERHGLKQ